MGKTKFTVRCGGMVVSELWWASVKLLFVSCPPQFIRGILWGGGPISFYKARRLKRATDV